MIFDLRQTGHITLISSTDPKVIAMIQEHARRTNAEKETLTASAAKR